ncbi:MAG: hypothetical protein WA957_17110 [Alteraurantiacibacter sp.]
MLSPLALTGIFVATLLLGFSINAFLSLRALLPRHRRAVEAARLAKTGMCKHRASRLLAVEMPDVR